MKTEKDKPLTLSKETSTFSNILSLEGYITGGFEAKYVSNQSFSEF